MKNVFIALAFLVAPVLHAEPGTHDPSKPQVAEGRPEAPVPQNTGVDFIKKHAKPNSPDLVRKDGSLYPVDNGTPAWGEMNKAIHELAEDKNLNPEKLTQVQRLDLMRDLILDKKTNDRILYAIFNDLQVAKILLASPKLRNTIKDITEPQRKQLPSKVEGILKDLCTRLNLADGYWQVQYTEKQAEKMLGGFEESIKAFGNPK